MQIGDIVVRKSYGKDITFKVIDIKENEMKNIFVLKGINLRIIADSPLEDLEEAVKECMGETERIFDTKVNLSIKKVLEERSHTKSDFRSNISQKNEKSIDFNNKDLIFGRPGRILHIDGDSEYLNNCMKVYKELSLETIGKVIAEGDQPSQVVELVKQFKPDIVVITGHDGIIKGAHNYMDLNNYRNSKFFVKSVSELRNYEPNYDDLVIFAGACQSCYEAILDAGANFASSPSRVLIHCLDPVFICEKIAYTNIEKIVSIQDIIKNTITGIKGIGGLQTRGKYREGFPKSLYV